MDAEAKLARGIIKKTEKGLIVWRPADPDSQEQERRTDKKYEALCGDMRLAVGHEMLAWPIDRWTQCFLKINDGDGETVFCQKNMGSAPMARLFHTIDEFCNRKLEEHKESTPKQPARERLTKKLLRLLSS